MNFALFTPTAFPSCISLFNSANSADVEILFSSATVIFLLQLCVKAMLAMFIAPLSL
uniref:Uncharacterized protein n=1 Tax=Yersinia enterocolitica TaxID=630 RepID=B0RKX7_YEREN|nr:hypothetical protein [Yersinia enterocolitica]